MNYSADRRRGSGLFVVLMMSAILGIGIYSVLDLTGTEFRANKKAAVYNEAKQASESLLQASIADLKTRFDRQTAFPVDALAPSRNPLYISDEFASTYSREGSGSHLIIPEVRKYTSIGQFNSQDTEIIGGLVPPGNWRYIDPRIPGNQYDELAGTRVFERSIEMLSKATVERPVVGKSTVHARQFLQVRDAPLFAYAIFYNLPMEIAPGPKMEIYGNVHSNKDTWIQASTGLDFNSKITISGNMSHGRHPDSGKSNSDGPVKIRNGSEQLVSMKEDSSWPSNSRDEFGGGWLESASDSFYDLSNQVWNGNVQTSSHGVLPQNPVGVSDYIEDTTPGTASKDSFNSAYSLIQPVLNESKLSIPSASDDPDAHAAATALNEVEKQKYSYKAGLTIEVSNDGEISYYTYKRDSNGDLKYNDSGSPKKRKLTPSESIARYSPFSESGDQVTSGMHDKRQAQDLDIINVDIEKLKDLVHYNDAADWGGDDKQQPEEWWNGVVYVDFPQQRSDSIRPDNVNPAKSGWGVKLQNGAVIPNPSFAHSKAIYGMSVATNQMMYIQGDYNADGDRSSGSPTLADDLSQFTKENHEAPAALIADSLTFLSNEWKDSNSAKSMSSRIATDTEVSAAILTGLVPSGETGSDRYSGGVENFPRFLENWKGKSLRIRGSMVALFESEVGTRGWGYSDVYSPPNRDWGFHSKFGEGYLPPGTPNTRRYRGIDFQLVDEAEYESHIARIKSYF